MATAPDRPRPSNVNFPHLPTPAPPAAADVATELEEFHRYLGKLLAGGIDPRSGPIGDVSIETAVAQFRIYQDGLRQMREALRPALESSARGDGRAWDKQEFLEQLDRELAAEG